MSLILLLHRQDYSFVVLTFGIIRRMWSTEKRTWRNGGHICTVLHYALMLRTARTLVFNVPDDGCGFEAGQGSWKMFKISARAYDDLSSSCSTAFRVDLSREPSGTTGWSFCVRLMPVTIVSDRLVVGIPALTVCRIEQSLVCLRYGSALAAWRIWQPKGPLSLGI